MQESFRPRRSALYMPGSNARALEKAKSIAADVLILDLEDSVAPDAKATARDLVVAAVKAGGFGKREVVVRVNGDGTPWHEDDLKAAAAVETDAILIPKVSTGDALVATARKLESFGWKPRTRLWAMMETPLGVLNAGAIAAVGAAASQIRLTALVLGTNDLAKETRAVMTADRLPMLSWLMTCVAAARAHGLDILDGVYNNFRDIDGCRAEAEQGRLLGMDGKTLIHPDQVAVANAVFSPSAAAIAEAEKIVAAFAMPENAGRGVITLEGRMVERLHADMARRTVAIAEAIKARGG
jgi:citrate lyase subunit beta/citryl-CoA lyase